MRAGTLWVGVRTSAWAAQLSFLRTDLLTALNRRIGQPGLRGLSFRLETADVAGEERRETTEPSRAEPVAGPTPADAAVIDTAANQVSDSAVRHAWRRALTAAVVRRRRLGE